MWAKDSTGSVPDLFQTSQHKQEGVESSDMKHPIQLWKSQLQILSYLLLNIASGTVAGAMQIVVPLYAISLHAALSQVGLIRGVSGIGTLLLVIPAGFLIDHYGSKRLFLIGALAGTVSTFLLSYAQVPLHMTLIMGIAGLFGSLKMNAINSSFFSNLQSMGIEKAGWFKGSMSIGLTFIGPVLGGYMVHELNYGTIFRILSAGTLIPIALVMTMNRESALTQGVRTFQESIQVQLDQFKALITRKVLYLPLITEATTTGFFATFSSFSVVLAVRQMHLQVVQASTLITIEGALFIVTVFLASPLIKLLSMLQLYALSIVVIVSGIAALVIARDYKELVVSAVIMGLGLGLLNLVVSSWIGRLRGEKGKIVGLFSASVAIGASLCPMIGGFIGASFGIRTIFATFIPLFALLLGFAWWCQRQGDLEESDHTQQESLEAAAEVEAVAEELATAN